MDDLKSFDSCAKENKEELSEDSEDDVAQDGEEQIDFNASATESDTSSHDGDGTCEKSKDISLTQNILDRYQSRQGKQLYIRFPHRVPDDDEELQRKALGLSSLITNVHKPRQKHARFCLVDFRTREDRDAALKAIRTAIKTDTDVKGVVVSIPRTECDTFVRELAERKMQSLENKKAKARLRRASKLALRAKNFTSAVVVQNLPKSSSVEEVRKLFPNAVDIQIKPGKGNMNGASLATVTLPSTLEARSAFKQKLSIGGTKLSLRFDIPKLKKRKCQPNVNRKNRVGQTGSRKKIQ